MARWGSRYCKEPEVDAVRRVIEDGCPGSMYIQASRQDAAVERHSDRRQRHIPLAGKIREIVTVHVAAYSVATANRTWGCPVSSLIGMAPWQRRGIVL
jgi:hypothetical protein